MSKKRPKEPEDALEQFGKMVVEGPAQARFWIRALQLQDEIGEVQATIQAKPERKQASVPAIGHYVVDEKFKWIYVLNFTVDVLGARNVLGKVWLASPKYEPQAFKARNELADQLMKALDERHKSLPGEYVESPFDIEIRHFEQKKETDLYENPPDDKS